MSRQFYSVIIACAVGAALITPVRAQPQTTGLAPHIVARKSSKKGSSTVYLAARLVTGHVYRIEITSPRRIRVDATAFQNYAFVTHRQLVQHTKPFSMGGKTPYSYTLRPPTADRLTEWDLAVNVHESGHQRLTVMYRDLGKSG